MDGGTRGKHLTDAFQWGQSSLSNRRAQDGSPCISGPAFSYPSARQHLWTEWLHLLGGGWLCGMGGPAWACYDIKF